MWRGSGAWGSHGVTFPAFVDTALDELTTTGQEQGEGIREDPGVTLRSPPGSSGSTAGGPRVRGSEAR